jgi:hypothetical protein
MSSFHSAKILYQFKSENDVREYKTALDFFDFLAELGFVVLEEAWFPKI